MKRVTTLIAAIVIVMAAGMSSASAGEFGIKKSKFKLYNKGKKVDLVYLSDNAVQVEIEVSNANGKVFYEGTTSAEKGFILPFDLTNLPEGEYKFSLNDGKETISSTVETTATLTKPGLIDVIKAVDTKAFVVTSKKEIPSTIAIQIYNDKDKLVYSGAFDKNEVIERKFLVDDIYSNTIKIILLENDIVLKEKVMTF